MSTNGALMVSSDPVERQPSKGLGEEGSVSTPTPSLSTCYTPDSEEKPDHNTPEEAPSPPVSQETGLQRVQEPGEAVSVSHGPFGVPLHHCPLPALFVLGSFIMKGRRPRTTWKGNDSLYSHAESTWNLCEMWAEPV